MNFVVKHFPSGKERLFSLSQYNTFNFFDIQENGILVSEIWERSILHFPLADSLALVLLYDGKFFSSGEERIKINSCKPIVCLLQVPPSVVDNLKIDPLSVSSALEWLNSEECELYDSHNNSIAQFTMMLSTANLQESSVDHNDNETQQYPPGEEAQNLENPNLNNPQQQQQHQQQQHWIYRWIRVSLIARLAIFYFVFYHEREESFEQKAIIIGGLFVVYLLQVGLFSSIFQSVMEILRARNDRVREDVAAQQPEPVRAVAAQQPHRAPAEMSLSQRLSILFEHLVQHGVYLPRSPGILYDILSLGIALVGSLFPGWNVFQPPPNYVPLAAGNAPPVAPRNAAIRANQDNDNENMGFF